MKITPFPKSGIRRSPLLERSPESTSESLVFESTEKATGMGSPVGSRLGCKYQMCPPLERLAGTQRKEERQTQIQEERGDVELLPARAETRLPPGKVTATKSVPSCAGTDTLKGLNGRQHQLSSRGERQGSPPRRL